LAADRYALSRLKRRARRVASSRRYRQILTNCRDAGARDSELQILSGLLLAEMTARPLDARAVEWTVAELCRQAPLARLKAFGESITVGPFQLRGGRWRDDAPLALDLLRAMSLSELDEACTAWNGTPSEAYRLVAQLGYHSSVVRHLLQEASAADSPGFTLANGRGRSGPPSRTRGRRRQAS
jgi:hypothetical protein